MNNAELLELAARAAGAEINGYRWSDNGREALYGIPHEVEDGIEFRAWNPLTDDGDALRLSVALEMDVMQRRSDPEVWVQAPMLPTVREPFNRDRNAAPRRAIVRAAAEIGKGASHAD